MSRFLNLTRRFYKIRRNIAVFSEIVLVYAKREALAYGEKEVPRKMLGWSLLFLIVALIAAVFGFGGIAAASAGIAKILFFVFLILFVVSLFFRGGRAAL